MLQLLRVLLLLYQGFKCSRFQFVTLRVFENFQFSSKFKAFFNPKIFLSEFSFCCQKSTLQFFEFYNKKLKNLIIAQNILQKVFRLSRTLLKTLFIIEYFAFKRYICLRPNSIVQFTNITLRSNISYSSCQTNFDSYL